MEHRHDYLIVGGGMAADAAAKAIRENDASASIGIVSDDPHAPYERPPLSKALWKGDKTPASIDLGTARSNVEMFLGHHVVALDRAGKSARDDHGDVYRYRRLLLATGATPRRPSWGTEIEPRLICGCYVVAGRTGPADFARFGSLRPAAPWRTPPGGS